MLNDSQFITVFRGTNVTSSKASGCAHHLAAMQMGALVYQRKVRSTART